MRAMTDDRQRRLRAKNLALLWVLLGLVALFFVMSLVKMGAF
jgi:uncharacterized membrane protein